MPRMELVLLGTGAARPDVERSSPASLLRIGERLILVDCGEGATTQLLRAGVDLRQVQELFFTHLHTDHTLGYAQFVIASWAEGRRALSVWGPPCTTTLTTTLFHELYREDVAWRSHIGRPTDGIWDIAVTEVPDEPGTLVVVERDGVRVTAVRVVHPVPTFAYRFDCAEESVVFSGDTAYCVAVADLARGADLLVHECALAESARASVYRGAEGERIWANLQSIHVTPRQAGQIAQLAGVPRLVLHHISRGADRDEIRRQAAQTYDGELIIGEDLMRIDVRRAC